MKKVESSSEQQHVIQAFAELAPPYEKKMDSELHLFWGWSYAELIGTLPDIFLGLVFILRKMGERFASGSVGMKLTKDLLKPRTIVRLLRGLIKAKLQHRPLLPKDIWKLKGIMTGGMDTEIYREKEKLEYYWGMKPLEGYACTEGGMVAMQTWNLKGMVFFTDCNFYEFIPYAETLKNTSDPSYQPEPVTLDEVKPGIYEVVFTSLLGGALMRYRIGDLVNFISMSDERSV